MPRFFRALALTFLAFLFLPIAMAFAADAVTAGGSSVLNLGDALANLLPILGELASLAVAWLIGVVLLVLKQRFGLDIEARHREALHRAIMSGLGAAYAKFGPNLGGVAIDVKSPVVAEALAYVLKSVPDAIKFFGVTPERLREMTVAKTTEAFPFLALGDGSDFAEVPAAK